MQVLTLEAIEKEVNSSEFQNIVSELSKYSDKIEEALNFDNISSYISNLSESEFYSKVIGVRVHSVNEQLAALTAGSPEEMMSSQYDAALGGSEAPESQGGILSIAKNLLSSLTEGGSMIGILHLILDIVGIIGDAVFTATGFPLGTIADFLNGMIYFFRGPDKYLLGIISLVFAPRTHS